MPAQMFLSTECQGRLPGKTMEEFQVSTILQLMDSNYLQDHLLFDL